MNFRTEGETWGVVRSLEEIASCLSPAAADKEVIGPTDQLAGILRSLGILKGIRSSYVLGVGGGIGHRSRNPHPGGVNQRKPGSHWGAGSSDAGRAVCWRWGVTR
ncbi:hypothetical protein GCM10022232_28960 [Streptomyces plumbiresistens]|uniref:Uncharacterized protein n=1 Tax=Streptomyces plumbiresistens TaxID=511811 RepID=A0ABP7R5F3_9ACTN